MELLALLAIFLLTAIGLTACRCFLARLIPPEDRFYFAPAVGAGICAVIAYLATHLHQSWLISLVALGGVTGVIWWSVHFRRENALDRDAWRLLRFTLLTILCLYGMEICLFHLYAAVYPGPNPVWTLYNLTGVSPPDQMFAWHQARFANSHLHYPQDPFYADMDLYDRPQLGGYLTLFFFKLFRLSLHEDHFEYPATSLRFYHSLWWLLNDLYLLGVAPLFKHLLGRRAAVIAIGSTALGSFFFLCSTGVWTKFASAYPLLLAFCLFLSGSGPVLQAALCAISYYIHGSVIPFLGGFGMLQILTIFYPIKARLTPRGDVLKFALVGGVLVGAWFLTVHEVGSKQPLLYYYLYDAGLTEAQTRPVAEIAHDFYATHSRSDLVQLPLRAWLRSLFPASLLSTPSPAKHRGPVSVLADYLLGTQRTCALAVLGLITAPVCLVSLGQVLARKYAGRVALCLYLLPTLLMLLLYRKEWALLLHIVIAYHALALFLWVRFFQKRRTSLVTSAVAAIALEGMICVLFAEFRFLPAHSVELRSLPGLGVVYLAGYVTLSTLR